MTWENDPRCSQWEKKAITMNSEYEYIPVGKNKISYIHQDVNYLGKVNYG